jgi:hypothetical protein
MRASRTTSWRTGLGVSLLVLAGTAGSVPAGNANPVVPATFASIGPAGITTSHPNGPRAGAINSFAVKPGNANVIWIGSVNGGVWKTTDATSSSPSWTPLTDHEASLSIGALALDPTDANADTLVAGVGTTSSLSGGIGGPLTGILRTTDGGSHWTALGTDDLSSQDLSGVGGGGEERGVGPPKGS